MPPNTRTVPAHIYTLFCLRFRMHSVDPIPLRVPNTHMHTHTPRHLCLAPIPTCLLSAARAQVRSRSSTTRSLLRASSLRACVGEGRSVWACVSGTTERCVHVCVCVCECMYMWARVCPHPTQWLWFLTGNGDSTPAPPTIRTPPRDPRPRPRLPSLGWYLQSSPTS